VTNNTKTITLALARIPRSGPLRRDLLAETDVVTKRLRPVLAGYRLSAILICTTDTGSRVHSEAAKSRKGGVRLRGRQQEWTAQMPYAQAARINHNRGE
jgi:hypothetical protein